MMRNASDLTKQEVLNLIRDCFADLSETYGQGYQPQSVEIDLELAEQRVMAHDHVARLAPQVETRSFDLTCPPLGPAISGPTQAPTAWYFGKTGEESKRIELRH